MDQAPNKSYKAPRKSLAIPREAPPAEYRSYVEHPEVATLNQIMLHYLEIEEILKLYRQDREHTVGRRFETRQALGTLATRFDLPAAVDFKQLLRAYDMQYATVRSYLYNNRIPEQILYQAALEGNVQAFYNQLKLYPELRNEKLYTTALVYAAEGGHEAIMELLFDLGAQDTEAVLSGAAKGGQLTLVLRELAKGVEAGDIEKAVMDAAAYRHKDVVVALLEYRINDDILEEAMAGAGKSGDTDIIEYVISRGGNNYVSLIDYASIHRHFDVVRKYWDKLDNPTIEFSDNIFHSAISRVDLATVKFLVERKLVSQGRLELSLGNLKRKHINLFIHAEYTDNLYTARYAAEVGKVTSIIAYLESKGVVNNEESSEESTTD